MVRIFITPYRTRISEEDLKFTHGDFNVELVLALGVENKEVLDAAIAAHGRILHDATVATINAQNKKSNLGSIDWQDPNASSLCEMLVAMSESLQSGLLDEQIATAFLTGIVAATNRFSNSQTSPKSMTMAAQLMAAGANQQLIAAKLEETAAISSEKKLEDGSTELDEGSSKKVREKPADKAPDKTSAKPKENEEDLGEITIAHSGREQPADESPDAKKPPYLASATIEEHEKYNKQVAGEEALSEALSKLGAASSQAASQNLNDELEKATVPSVEEVTDMAPTHEEQKDLSKSWRDQALLEPSMGGELNATTKEAAETKRKEDQSRINKVIMDHEPAAPVKGRTITPPSSHEENQRLAISSSDTLSEIENTLKGVPSPSVEKTVSSPAANDDTAPAPMQPSLPSAPANVLPPPPPALPEYPTDLPDFSKLPPLPPSSPAVPPLDANGLPMPGSPQSPPAAPQAPPVTPPASTEPGQFRIPGR